MIETCAAAAAPFAGAVPGHKAVIVGDLSRLDTSAFVSALPGAGEADVETVPAGEIAGNAGNLSQMKTAAFVSARSGAGEADVETMPAGEIAGNGPWRGGGVAAAGPAGRAAGEPGTSPAPNRCIR